MHFRTGLLALLSVAAPTLVGAQSPAVGRAAATITTADVRRRINVIAHDSMMGRATPSPGLTKTAQYIADQFKKFGLKPGGDDGSWFQNYPIRTRQILADRSVLSFTQTGGALSARLTFAEGAAWAGESLEAGIQKGGLVLLGGAGKLDSIPIADLAGRVVIYIGDWTKPGASQRLEPLRRRLQTAGARGVVIVVNSDSVYSTRYAPDNRRTFVDIATPGSGFFTVAVKESAVLDRLPEAEAQFQSLRQAPKPVLQPMLDWQGELSVQDSTVTTAYAPNTVGILEGSDPTLKAEYVVFSAHMDHVGFRRTPADMPDSIRATTDTIFNGADDDASGTVGVVELAEAFSQAGVRPRRSLIFLTVSGEERGLWGSEWFVNHPPVSIKQIVANFNADMIGRNWKDTIVAIGKGHSDLGATLNRVNAAHPELKMTAIDDRWPEQSFYTRSDHYNFAQKGVPILFFFNGVHADYHRVTDSPDKIDAEKESRIIKLLFYVGLDVANAAQRPQWVPASYRQIVTP
jgi:hypothetical protein